MVLHLLPARAVDWILLHSLHQELKALERDLDVLWPCPRSLLNLAVQQLQSHLISCLLSYVEHEHACEHLVKDDPDGPHVDLVAVS